jgi:DNA-binding MarR family transcriptional regulator
VIRSYKPILDAFDISYTQYITLLVLWEQDGITMKELGQKLYLASNTLTPVIKKLEKKKLIMRLRNPNDERSIFIQLTELGLKMRSEAIEIPQKAFCKTGLELEELRTLRGVLHKLLGNLTEHYKEIEEENDNEKDY